MTRRGEDQARALAPILCAIPLTRVFTSPTMRARSTCALVGLAAVAETDPDLAEWDYGDYEGRLSSDIRKERRDWSAYRDGCPGGESVSHITARADRLIARLRTFGGAVALFSHGQFGCSLAARWIGLPVAHAKHLQLDTASFGVLSFNPNHPELAVIAHWNTTGLAIGSLTRRPDSDHRVVQFGAATRGAPPQAFQQPGK